MISPHSDARLPEVVQRLRDVAATVALPLHLDGVDAAREARAALIGQLDDYVLPRLRSMEAPLLCVVGGSTGAGKSTLVNSLVGEVVSRAGVLRPTTRASVLVHHPQDRDWFTDDRVLPGLTRVTGGRAIVESSGTERAAGHEQDPNSVRLVDSSALPVGLAVLDAPDIDSVVRSNREVARQVLAAADLWIFVTTASRYADAVPWDLLGQAAEHGTSVAVVLDRVPPEALRPVRTHLAELLHSNGLNKEPIFTIEEVALQRDGRLPDRSVAALSSWLGALAGDARARSVVIRRTLDGALTSLPARSRALRRAAAEQESAREELTQAVGHCHAQAASAVQESLDDGTLLRGEVLARWQELVGTGEFLRQVEAGIARARDRIGRYVRGKPAQTEPLGEALQTGAAALITSQAHLAAARTATEWRTTHAGAELVEEHPELTRATPEVSERVERIIRAWQGEVIELIRSQAGRKRATARYLAFGVNGLAVLLMLVVFSATAGLTGAEVAVAGGSAVLAQRLLEAVFGDQAVRDLAAEARRLLSAQVETLFAEQQQRYLEVLPGPQDGPDTIDSLDLIIRDLERRS